MKAFLRFLLLATPLAAFAATGLKDLSLLGTNTVLSGGVFSVESGATFRYQAGASFSGDAAEFRTDIGLGNVQNYSAAALPISTATQAALDLKAPLSSPAFTGTVTGITKAMVGLGSVDNTADTAKPISTATQTALDLKAPLASPTFTGTVGGITKAMVGLGNVDNTADASKPVSTAQATAIALKADNARTISTTAPLTGGGDLSANRTFAVSTATTSATGVAQLATSAETLTGTDTAKVTTPAGVAYAMAARAPPTRGGIISDGTAPVGVCDQGNLIALGTTSFHIGGWAQRPSLSTLKYYAAKFASNIGFKFEHDASDLLRLRIGNGSNFTTYAYPSSVATGVPAGAWFRWDAIVNRTSQTLTWLINGVQLGTPVNISGSSAQTLTLSGAGAPLYWGSDGTTHFVGTFGEHTMESGLLTASRIADICRAGSIAPGCVMTPNASTGQNTATIDGLSFFTWPEFDQGYGPIIRDRSGNNQHALMGTSGLFHAVRRNPPGVPQRAPSTALVSDGSITTLGRSVLSTQDPGSGQLLLYWDGVVPSDATTSPRLLAALTSAVTGDVFVAGACALTYDTTTGIALRLFAAGPSHFRYLSSPALRTLLSGNRATIVAYRNGTTPKIFVGVNGDWFDATNLFVESTSGTPPTWADAVTGTYLRVFTRDVTNGFGSAQTLHDLRLYNVALTEAQLREEYLAGEPKPEWTRASKTSVYTGNFATTDSWVASSGGTVAASGGRLNVTSVVGNVNSGAIRAATANVPRATYRMVLTVRTQSGANGDWTIGDGGSAAGLVDVATGLPSLFAVTGTDQTFTFILRRNSGDTLFFHRNLAGDSVIELAAISFERVGVTTRLRTDLSAGFVGPNDCYANGSSDFTLSTTGVTVAPEPPVGTRIPLRATYAHTDISATAGTTLIGSLPPNWAVVEVQANVTTGFDAGITLDVGTSSTSGRWVSAMAITTTGLRSTPSLQLYPQSASSATSVYLKKSGSTTAGAINVSVILERKY